MGKAAPGHAGPLPLEANNGLCNLRGTVALARGDEPDSAAAEFFINLADNTPLDHKPDDPGNTTGYAVFGQVIVRHGCGGRDSAVPVGDHGPMPGQAPVDADPGQESVGASENAGSAARKSARSAKADTREA